MMASPVTYDPPACVADLCTIAEQHLAPAAESTPPLRHGLPYIREITEVSASRFTHCPRAVIVATRNEMKTRYPKIGMVIWISIASLIVQVVRLLVDLWRRDHQVAVLLCQASGMSPIAASAPVREEW